jgi:hypothetical protein
VFAATLGTFEVLSIYLGDRLGWYRALAEAGPLARGRLAERTGTHERYAREWLEQQAVSGILTVDDRMPRHPLVASRCRPRTPRCSPTPTRSTTSPARPLRGVDRRALRRARRVSCAAAGCRGPSTARTRATPRATSTGRGSCAASGPALAGVPAMHAVLSRPGARIADIGSGMAGRRSPSRRPTPTRGRGVRRRRGVRGRGTEPRRRARGVAERVRFHVVGGEGLPQDAVFDAAFVFEALHDMPHPVEVLAAHPSSREARRPVVIMDEAVAPAFAPDGDDVERVMYGYSISRVPARQPLDARVGRHGHRHAAVDARGLRARGRILAHRGAAHRGLRAFRFTRLLH